MGRAAKGASRPSTTGRHGVPLPPPTPPPPVAMVPEALTANAQRQRLTSWHLSSLSGDNDLFAVLGRCLAKAGPRTPENGSGSKHDAERTKISPGGQF